MCSVGVAGAGPASDISRGARAGLGSDGDGVAGAGPASDISRGARAGLGSSLKRAAPEQLPREERKAARLETVSASERGTWRAPGPMTCLHCAQPARHACERCGASYCGRDCQLAHWPEHRSSCHRSSCASPTEPAAVETTPAPSPSKDGPALRRVRLSNPGPQERFLTVPLRIQTPSGEEILVTAMLDTGSEVDAVHSRLLHKLERCGVEIASTVGTELQVVGGGSTWTSGSLLLECHVATRDMAKATGTGLPRRVRFTTLPRIVDVPADVLLGLNTLRTTGLLQSVLAGLAEAEEIPAEVPDEMIYESAVPDEWPETITFGQLAGESNSNMTPAERAELQRVMHDFPELFGPAPKGGSSVLTPFDIELYDGMWPKALPPRHVSPAIQREIDAAMIQRIEQGWQRDLSTDSGIYSSPVVAARQPGKDTRRVCGDYRELNRCTKPCTYPTKNAQAITNRMKNARYFTKLDLMKGYLQLRMTERASQLCTVVTMNGAYEPVTMPFGVRNGPAVFQRRISTEVLRELEGHGVESFIDDICIYSETFEEHVRLLREVLSRLRACDLVLNGSKCMFGGASVEFLGVTVDGTGVAHTEGRKEALSNMSVPKDKSQLRCFLGIANFFRRHVQNFSRIAVPLTALTKKHLPFKLNWGAAEQAAFDQLKQAIVAAPMLKFLDYDREIRVRTDASKIGLGAVLFQVINGVEEPVAFLSKAFSATEQAWSTIEQELFAIVYACEKWAPMLLGHQFVVESDHRNLQWLEKATAPKLVRWRLRLQEFDFDLKHLPGKYMVVADALSRLHRNQAAPFVGVCAVGLSWLQEPERLFVGAVAPKVLRPPLPEGLDPDFVAEDGPISYFHGRLVGHFGVNATERKMLAANVTHARLREHIDYFVKACPMCQKIPVGRSQISHPEMQTTIAVDEPGIEWNVDVIGPIEPDSEGNRYIIALIDSFTRFLLLKAVKDTSAATAAKFLFEVAGIFELPRSIRSDNCSQFTAALIEAFLALLGVDRTAAIPYRPQSNGGIERSNKEIIRHATFIIMELRQQKDWSLCLPMVQRMINYAYHSAIGTFPARLVFGDMVTADRCLIPSKLTVGAEQVITNIPDKQTRTAVSDYINHLVQVQQQITQAAQVHQRGVIERRLAKSEPSGRQVFVYGDWVCVRVVDKPSKWAGEWLGPFFVLGPAANPRFYLLQDPCDLKEYEYDVLRLKRYHMGRTVDPVEIRARDTAEDRVQSILEHEMPTHRKASWQFKVKWEDGDITWEPWASIRNNPALDAYLKRHPYLKVK